MSFFDDLILHALHPDNIALRIGDFDEIVQNAKEQAKQIRTNLMALIFNFQKSEEIELFIQNHQNQLINLTDTLLKYLGPEGGKEIFKDVTGKTPSNLYKKLYITLEDLITFLEEYFRKYFNINSKITLSYRLITLRDFQETLPILESALHTQKVPAEFIEVLLQPIQVFIKACLKKEITYQRVLYLKSFLADLMEQSLKQNENTLLTIVVRCGYLNLNSIEFYNWCIGYLKERLEMEDNATDKLKTLSYFLKHINQSIQKPNFAYKPHKPSVKELVSSWIKEETKHLERTLQLSLEFANGEEKNVLSQKKADKIKLNLTVPQIAYFARLMIDANVYLNTNQTEVLKILSRTYSTSKAEQISPISLRSKFYSEDESTRESVKELLIKLLNEVNKRKN
ncbi:hypothetical protein [Solitalea longa]|uniref:hypothetical protein n=1 Tax=Solitalea longa TaxID=2079460 RepID=UPI0010574F8D|nr:hypothetical protein [Solitalea longa]